MTEVEREVLLAQARTLARAGRLTEADDLLSRVSEDGSPGVAALDLRARVHAQQGRLEEADAYWAEAERLAPGDPGIAAARRRVAALRDRPRRGFRAWRTAGRVVGGVLAFAVPAYLWWSRRARPSCEARPPAGRSACAPARR